MEKGYERDAGVSEHHIGNSKFQFESLGGLFPAACGGVVY